MEILALIKTQLHDCVHEDPSGVKETTVTSVIFMQYEQQEMIRYT